MKLITMIIMLARLRIARWALQAAHGVARAAQRLYRL